MPLQDGEPIDDQAFAALEPVKRGELMRRRDELMAELRPVAKQGQGTEVEAQQRLGDLQRTVATSVVDTLIDRFFEAFEDHEEAIRLIEPIGFNQVYVGTKIGQPKSSAQGEFSRQGR